MRVIQGIAGQARNDGRGLTSHLRLGSLQINGYNCFILAVGVVCYISTER